jgi:hypothetical protein
MHQRVSAPDGSPHELWLTLGDYRAVDGLRLPHAMNQSKVTYEVNKPVAAALFTRGTRLQPR